MKLRKLLIMMLSILTICSLFQINASAENLYKFSILSEEVAEIGSSYVVRIEAEFGEGLSLGNIDLNFDSDILEYASGEFNSSFSELLTMSNIIDDEKSSGKINLRFVNTSGIGAYSGAVAELEFNVKSTAALNSESYISLALGDTFISSDLEIVPEENIVFGYKSFEVKTMRTQTPTFEVNVLGDALVGNELRAEIANFSDVWGYQANDTENVQWSYLWSTGETTETITLTKDHLAASPLSVNVMVTISKAMDYYFTTVTQSDISVKAAGTCGENAMWEIDDNGLLTITGSGITSDYYIGDLENAPWYDNYRNNIYSCVIGEGITGVGASLLRWCNNLQTVTLPKTIAQIGKFAFDDCESLTQINVSDGGEYKSIDGVLFDKAQGTLIKYPEGRQETSYIVPDGVVNISDYAFSECLAIKSIVLANSVKYLGNESFLRCQNLVNIDLPDGMTHIGDGAFDVCTSLAQINIPKSVESIGAGAFAGSGLESIEIPQGITRIEESTFAFCSALKKVVLPEGITFIGEFAFWKSGIESIVIPEGVELLSCTFEDCYRLKSIVIPSSLKRVSNYAFTNCYNLKDVYYNGTAKDWDNIVIINSSSSTSDNFHFVNADRHYNCYYATDTVKAMNNSGTTTLHIAPDSSMKNKNVICTMHKGNRVVDKEVFTYSGTKLMFSTQKEFDKAVIMYVDSTSNLMPLCNAEIILADTEK